MAPRNSGLNPGSAKNLSQIRIKKTPAPGSATLLQWSKTGGVLLLVAFRCAYRQGHAKNRASRSFTEHYIRFLLMLTCAGKQSPENGADPRELARKTW